MITALNYIELLRARARSVNARMLELEPVFYAGLERQDEIEFTWLDHNAMLRFYVEESSRQAPYYRRLETAVNEAKAARDRIDQVSVITEAQINEVNEIIEAINVQIRLGQRLLRLWRESEMGRISRGEIWQVSYELLGLVSPEDIVGTIVATAVRAAQAISDAADRAGRAPDWVNYAIATVAFGGAGYLWYQLTRKKK